MMKNIQVHSIKSQTSEIFTNYSTVWDIVEISENLVTFDNTSVFFSGDKSEMKEIS